MHELIPDLLARGRSVSRYVVHEYWLDIGAIDDYERAQQAYAEHFHAPPTVGG
jgi:NDP-sugar pyrophosphorylase family protein